MNCHLRLWIALGFVVFASCGLFAQTPFDKGQFSWTASEPLIDAGPGKNGGDPVISIKDPTVVFYKGKWHVFATVRMKSGKVDMEYLNFADWSKAGDAQRQILGWHDQYYCAPEVFFFRPHNKWYLIYQLADKNRKPPFGPCFSTTTKLDDPNSWTKPEPMVTNTPPTPRWLDFWVICDSAKAHLFYTTLDGHLWRRETPLAEFPFGWSEAQLAIQADIFEASHTYKLAGRKQYLTIIEAQGDRRRYYKAYLADRLEGPWRGLADTPERPFAAFANLQQKSNWTANISHGELLRTGIDETLTVEPSRLRFLFQGASDEEYRGRNYGQIPWRLGLLELQR